VADGNEGKKKIGLFSCASLASQTRVNQYFLIGIIFVLVNSLKIDFIDYFTIFSEYYWLPNHPNLKILFYIVLNSIIFFSVLRFKNAIPFLIIYILQTLYLFVHLSYLIYFDAPFHARQFISEMYEGILLARHFSIPLNMKYLMVVFDLPLVILVVLYYSKIRGFLKSKRNIFNYLLILLIMLLIYFIPVYYRACEIIEDVRDRYKSEMWIVDKLGVIGNDVLDLTVFLDEKLIVDNFKYGNKVAFHARNTDQAYNIICIQVEALDSNIIDYKYKDQYICPFLHRLSSDCVYYPYMLFYHFAGGTSDTEFAAINGVIPAMYFPSLKIRNYSYSNSLVKQLLKANFNPAVFHNNEGSYYNRRVAFLKMGFQEFDDVDNMHLKKTGWGAPDHKMFDFVKEKLKRQKPPFFYYVITMSSHEPFRYVRFYYLNKFYDDIKDSEIAGYFNSFSYEDGVLNDFVTFVRNNLKNTYIFIYGDHNADTLRDNADLAFKNLGVPLFIITPDNKRYKEDKEIASVLDLEQTVLYASGIDFKVISQGTNLLDFPIKNGPVAVNGNASYDRELMFGQELAPFIERHK
jgi:phosphoglycerol transferase MdoB-like AlkP superfamily enzyme